MSSQQGWTAGPNSRGSFDILWSCLSTLGLCVWTAVHPNLQLKYNYTRAIISRIGMMCLAAVLPEVLLSSAWRQLTNARWLCSKINELNCTDGSLSKRQQRSLDKTSLSDAERPPCGGSRELSDASGFQPLQLSCSDSVSRRVALADRSHPDAIDKGLSRAGHSQAQGIKRGKVLGYSNNQWTIDVGFFAVMGGLAVELPNTSTGPAQGNVRRLITPEGVLTLAELSLLPSLCLEDVEDRSQADIIAKLIVFAQVLWFALQVIQRLAAHLPVTPLEAHTAVHVACTLVLYGVWLKKPYNVARSILLKDERVECIAALALFYELTTAIYARNVAAFEDERVKYWENRAVRAAQNLLDHDDPPIRPIKEPVETLLIRYSEHQDQVVSAVTAEQALLHKLITPARYAADLLKAQDLSVQIAASTFCRSSTENFAIRAIWGSWTTNAGHEMTLDKAAHFLFNVLYGAGHLAAWYSSAFPTDSELWLWRCSGLMLCAVPLWGFLWIMWWKGVGSTSKALYLVRNGDLDIVAAPLFCLLLVACILARLYFLVECLASLRVLPEGAYEVAPWISLLPHTS